MLLGQYPNAGALWARNPGWPVRAGSAPRPRTVHQPQRARLQCFCGWDRDAALWITPFFNRVRFVPGAAGPSHLRLGAEVVRVRSKNTVEKRGQKVPWVRGRGRSGPAIAWPRARSGALDDGAIDSDPGAGMAAQAGVPPAARLGTVV